MGLGKTLEQINAASYPQLMEWGGFCLEKIIREGGEPSYHSELFEELLLGADFTRTRRLRKLMEK